MDRYLTRVCPRCGGHIGIYMQEPERDQPLQAVNGQCVRCRYRLAWIVIRGRDNIGKPRRRKHARIHRPIHAPTIRPA